MDNYPANLFDGNSHYSGNGIVPKGGLLNGGRGIGLGAEILHGDGEPSVSDVIAFARKYRRLIFLTTLSCVVAACLYCLAATKMYTSTTSLEIGGYAPVLPGGELERIIGQDTRKQDYQKTTIAKLKLMSIADEVLSRDNLAVELQEYFRRTKGGAAGLLSWVNFGGPKEVGERSERSPASRYSHAEPLLQDYLGLVDVHPVEDTSLVEVSATTADARLSQRVANAHSEAFIDHLRNERQKGILANLKLLQTQADELQEKVTASEQNLAMYAESNELLSLSKDENIVVKQIADLTGLLVTAMGRRIRSESLLRQVESRSLEDSTALDDQSIRELRVALKEARAEYADMNAKVTPAYPAMTQLKAKIDSLTQTVNEERRHTLNALRTSYESDLSAENKLIAQIEGQKAKAHEVTRKLVQYNILEREYESLQDLYQNVLKQLKESQISSTGGGSNVFISDFAALPLSPSRPLKSLVILAGLFGGLLVGLLMALLFEVMDNTIKTAEEAQQVLGLASLGVVPSFPASLSRSARGLAKSLDGPETDAKIKDGRRTGDLVVYSRRRSGEADLREFVTVSAPQATVSEAFRTIRAAILLSSAEHPPRVVMVTSAKKNEGKTTLVSNLAITIAQSGQRTILVDGDVRQSKLAERFSVSSDKAGLVEVLTGNASLDDAISETSVENLSIVGAGSLAPNPAELVGSRQMQSIIGLLRERYDYVLLDTPPVLPVSDSLMLSRFVDGVVVVARSHGTERNLAREATRRLQQVNAPILGVVVNDVDLNISEHYYGRHYSDAPESSVRDRSAATYKEAA